MNENIDLTKILMDCPKGFKLYSSVHGDVKFSGIDANPISPWITVTDHNNVCIDFTPDGKYSIIHNGECVLFPSKNQRDWSKFTAPWYKKEKFDPKTLQPYDKILVRDSRFDKWMCGIFSHINDNNDEFRYYTVGTCYGLCIPYNDDTKHLVGKTEAAPEYYRYWED